MSLAALLQAVAASPAALGTMALLLVAALAAGWALGKKGSQAKPAAPTPVKRSPSDDAFIKGVTHLMADHTDQAIEEFTKSVTLNSETVETYMVLGNLFRQKGEIERAVRIRQSIILRPKIDQQMRLQALYDLGMDYKKGGLYNRAVQSLEEVLAEDPKREEALGQMVNVYEEMRDWDNAVQALKKLDRITGGDHKNVLAHYQTERGKELAAAMQLDQAEIAFNQAVSTDKKCLDAYLHLGDLELTRGREKKALSVWRKAIKLAPEQSQLVIGRVAAAEDSLDPKAVAAFFAEVDVDQAGPLSLVSLADRLYKRGNPDEAVRLLDRAVSRTPNLMSAHALRGEILLDQERRGEVVDAFRLLLARVARGGEAFECRQCGHAVHQLTWKCPRCHRWDTIEARL